MGDGIHVLVVGEGHVDFPMIGHQVRQHLDIGRCRCVVGLSELTLALASGRWEVVLFLGGCPDADFEEVLSVVRAHDDSLPLIVVSERVGEERAVELLKRGAWDFVLEDDPSRLIPAIQRSFREASDRRSRSIHMRDILERVELYGVLVEYAEDFVAMHHVDGRRLYLSPSYWKVTGWQPDEIQPADWRTRTHPDDLAFIEAARDANLRGETTCIEHRTLCKNGSWMWTETRCRPLLGPDGKVERMVLWSRDVTERKEAAAKHALLMNQFLQAQKMEAVGRLAGGVAHDFNNMLQTIMGTTELLLSVTASDDPRFADLNEIAKAAQRSADLTRQLLAFARKQTIAPKVLDLDVAVTETLKMLRRLIGENIALRWCPAGGLWPVEMDPSQLDQILANLVVNARDAIAGSGHVTIETGMESFDEPYCQNHPDVSSGDYVMLAVSDDGCGMGQETLARLFEPFFTTKSDGKGTGLGLATVYGIVSQNHGVIRVTSESGKGTTFRIYLPRHRESGEKEKEAHSSVHTLSGAETVLLVEDEEPLLRLSRRLLETLGYHVLVAGSPQEALRLASEFQDDIHVLVTDVIMPEMDGRELQERLTASRPGLKCLFMSGYPADTIARCGVLEKGVFFIQKPFSKATLGLKLCEVLSGKTDEVTVSR